VNEFAYDSTSGNNFDLFRISRSKKVADVSSNTVRKYHREHGLRLFYSGGTTWVSKFELQALIKRIAGTQSPRRKSEAKAETRALAAKVRCEDQGCIDNQQERLADGTSQRKTAP
jgi:hypothetical protein